MNNKLRSKVVEIYGTQSDFAQAIGVSDSQISRVIRCRRNLSLIDQMKWSLFLRSTPEELFTQEAIINGR